MKKGKYKVYFKKPDNPLTMFRVDKNLVMNKLVAGNWEQIQKDFDRQLRLWMAKPEQERGPFKPLPLRLALTNAEMEIVLKKIGSAVAYKNQIDVFYDNQNYHLCSFVSEDEVIKEEKKKLNIKEEN